MWACNEGRDEMAGQMSRREVKALNAEELLQEIEMSDSGEADDPEG